MSPDGPESVVVGIALVVAVYAALFGGAELLRRWGVAGEQTRSIVHVLSAILALGLTGIPGYYRLTRASAISLSQLPYVEAARALGGSGARLIFTHILPNLLTSLVVLTSLRLGTFLLAGRFLQRVRRLGPGRYKPVPSRCSDLLSRQGWETNRSTFPAMDEAACPKF